MTLPNLNLPLTTPPSVPALNPATKQMESMKTISSAVKSTVRDVKHSIAKDVEKAWEEHSRAWDTRNVEGYVKGFSSDGSVVYVPNGTGAKGRDAIRAFFDHMRSPPCWTGLERTVLNTTVGHNSIVVEETWSWLHNAECREILPGVPASNRQIRLSTVLIATFVDADPSQILSPLLIQSLRIYWDQASVLDQLAGKPGDAVVPFSVPTNDKVPDLRAKIQALALGSAAGSQKSK